MKKLDPAELDDAPSNACPHCHRNRDRLYSVTDSGVVTKNYFLACPNTQCMLFVDPGRIKTWKKK